MNIDSFLSTLTFSCFKDGGYHTSWTDVYDHLIDAKQLKSFVLSTLKMMLDETFDVTTFAKRINKDSLARNCLMNVFFFALDIRKRRNQLTQGEELLFSSEIKDDLAFWQNVNNDNFSYSTPIWDEETFNIVVDSGILENEYETTNFCDMMAVAMSYCLSQEDSNNIMRILWECLPRERFTITDYVIGHLTYTTMKEVI